MKDSSRLLWLALLLASTSLSADVLRLAGNAWPPYTDRRLPEDGLSVELIRTALGRAGYRIEYIEVPWERALLGLKTGSYDMVNGWPALNRADYVRRSQPFLTNRMRWVQRRDSDIRYDGLASLAVYPVALSRGYGYSEELENDSCLNKGYVANFVQAARMLLVGRVDLTLEDERTALFHFRRELKQVSDALSFVPGEFSLRDLSLAVRNSHPQQAAILAAFNREIAAMEKEGSYAAIFLRHGLPAPEALPQP
ncbi:substrate-binding periplasmic protein [Pseudomonas sp. CBC3]|uniref:substrate-binding periplasmic protein n=1 Tax=Pseudomonas sp. CBC3 TaxID=3123318 RepID=UPI0030E78DC3